LLQCADLEKQQVDLWLWKMSFDTPILAGAFQQVLFTFTYTSPYWAEVQATEPLSAVVEQRLGPSMGLKGRVSGW